ncbi:MAG: hypothetical protein GY757_34560 [bacterium]|nr:hypothetical protein [bacterium]
MINTDKHFFKALNWLDQVRFLKSDDFNMLDRCIKIDFLKDVLKTKLPPKTTACAIKTLGKVNYHDRYFFRKFLYHRDSFVSNAAKKAMKPYKELAPPLDKKVKEMLLEGNTCDRLLITDCFLGEKGKVNEDILLSFLAIGDFKVRESIVKKISPAHELDEKKLSDAIKSGSVWYVRAALVEILGKRKSAHFTPLIDILLKDTNVEVKLKLLDALLKWGKKEARKHIERLANDSILWVRKEARRALQTMA